MSIFKKAEKSQSRLRLAICGTAGSGKTLTALRIARGITNKIGGKIAMIDTERFSGSKYAGEQNKLPEGEFGFDFDIVPLNDPKPGNYVYCIKEAGKEGYSVLIVDSISHGWRELLEEIDKLKTGKYKNNSWQAWSEGTPMQKEFINTIMSFPGHIICTMRVKTEWTTEKDDRGKTRPVKIGMTPEQREGVEYEFDMVMEISQDHWGTISKARAGRFQDLIINRPGEELGEEIVNWLMEGTTEQPKAPEMPKPVQQQRQLPPVQPTIKDDPPEEKPKTATNSLGRNPNIDYAKELYGGGEDAFSGTDENLINKMSSLMAEIEQLIIDNCHESEKVFFVDQAAEAFDKSNLAELEQIKKQLSSRVKSNSSGWTEPEEFVKVTIPELQKKITTALIILGKQGIYGYENQTRLDNSVKSNIGNLNCQDREKLIKYIIKLRERYNEFKQQQK